LFSQTRAVFEVLKNAVRVRIADGGGRFRSTGEKIFVWINQLEYTLDIFFFSFSLPHRYF